MAIPAPPFQELSSTAWQQYQQQLATTQLQQPVGAAIEAGLALQKDLAADRIRLALKAKMPGLAPPDALSKIGLERGMPQGQTEGSSAYAARLLDAWNAWPWAGTAFGLLRAFYSTGYTNVVLAQPNGGQLFTLDNGGTNLALWSNGFSHWAKSANAGVTENNDIAPDGTITATKLFEGSTSSAEHYVDQAVAISAGSATCSVYARAVERSFLLLTMVLRDAATVSGVSFNLSTGTIGTTLGGFAGTSRITPVGNGWYRCEITGSVGTGGANPRMRLYCSNADGVRSYVGVVGSGIDIAYAQPEQSSVPASAYVQTYAVAKTSTAGAGVLLVASEPGGIWQTDPLLPGAIWAGFNWGSSSYAAGGGSVGTSNYFVNRQFLWNKFDVLFPLPLNPPGFSWALTAAQWSSFNWGSANYGNAPVSTSDEANFIRALIQAWKPAHAVCNRIIIAQQGNLFGYPAAAVAQTLDWGSFSWGVSAVWNYPITTVWSAFTWGSSQYAAPTSLGLTWGGAGETWGNSGATVWTP